MSVVALRRERHLEQLIDAAERQIAARSLSGLKARDLAAEIGIALGAIYNLVADLDELIMRVTSRTLRRLDFALSQAAPDDSPCINIEEATSRLVTIAKVYREFASCNLHLWRTMFEHRMPFDSVLPDWLVEDQMRLFRHILQPLAVLLPHTAQDEREMMARSLFGAVHGIVTLGLEEKLVAVPVPALDHQLETLVRITCRGMVMT